MTSSPLLSLLSAPVRSPAIHLRIIILGVCLLNSLGAANLSESAAMRLLRDYYHQENDLGKHYRMTPSDVRIVDCGGAHRIVHCRFSWTQRDGEKTRKDTRMFFFEGERVLGMGPQGSGSLEGGGQWTLGDAMIFLERGYWDEMAFLDPFSAIHQNWAEELRWVRRQGRFALIFQPDPDQRPAPGSISTRQIAAIILANWATRQKGNLPATDIARFMSRARDMAVRDPVYHPVVAYELAWLWRVVEPSDTARETALLAKVLKVPTQVPAATDRKAAAYQTTMSKRAAKRLRDFRNRDDLRLVLEKNAVDAAWRIIARGGGDLPRDMRLRSLRSENMDLWHISRHAQSELDGCSARQVRALWKLSYDDTLTPAIRLRLVDQLTSSPLRHPVALMIAVDTIDGLLRSYLGSNLVEFEEYALLKIAAQADAINDDTKELLYVRAWEKASLRAWKLINDYQNRRHRRWVDIAVAMIVAEVTGEQSSVWHQDGEEDLDPLIALESVILKLATNVEEDSKQAADVQAIGTVLRGFNILRQAKKAESEERMLDLMDTALEKFGQGAALAQQSGISELSQFFQELASGGESGQMEARAERDERMRYEHLVGKERDFKSVPKVLRGTWRGTPSIIERYRIADELNKKAAKGEVSGFSIATGEELIKSAQAPTPAIAEVNRNKIVSERLGQHRVDAVKQSWQKETSNGKDVIFESFYFFVDGKKKSRWMLSRRAGSQNFFQLYAFDAATGQARYIYDLEIE